MKYAALLALLVITALPDLGQKEPLAFTETMANGRFWKQCNKGERILYINAVNDTLDLTQQSNRWPRGFTIGDVVEEITKVYDHAENFNIPIIAVFDYCATKLKGERTTAELEQILTELRKLFIKKNVR